MFQNVNLMVAESRQRQSASTPCTLVMVALIRVAARNFHLALRWRADNEFYQEGAFVLIFSRASGTIVPLLFEVFRDISPGT